MPVFADQIQTMWTQQGSFALLCLARVGGMLMLAPVLGHRSLPTGVKIALVVALTAVVVTTMPAGAYADAPAWSGGLLTGVAMLLPAMAVEACIGLLIGFAAAVPILAMRMGGHVIDQQLGLQTASAFGGGDDTDGGIFEPAYSQLALVMFVLLNGHHAMVQTLLGSFQAVPVGAYENAHALVDLPVGMLASAFALALQVAGPIVVLTLAITVVMGVIARGMPTINLLTVGLPLRLMLGILGIVGSLAVVSVVISRAIATWSQHVPAVGQ